MLGKGLKVESLLEKELKVVSPVKKGLNVISSKKIDSMSLQLEKEFKVVSLLLKGDSKSTLYLEKGLKVESPVKKELKVESYWRKVSKSYLQIIYFSTPVEAKSQVFFGMLIPCRSKVTFVFFGTWSP